MKTKIKIGEEVELLRNFQSFYGSFNKGDVVLVVKKDDRGYGFIDKNGNIALEHGLGMQESKFWTSYFW